MSLNGIDISGWQAGINIGKLSTTDFVIVKATGGTSYTSDQLTAQANAALAAGKLLGLYHYAREKSCAGSALAEAKHFYEAARPFIGKAVLVLDWEQELSCGESWALAWLNEVKRLTGVAPLFYCYQGALEAYRFQNIADAGYQLWLAQYPNYTTTDYKSSPWQSGSIGAFDSYIMHQYTSSGRITGYSGNLDLDLFYGSRADWEALCGSRSTGSGSPAATSSTTTKGESDVQIYQNGSTKEPVYQTSDLTEKIGSLNAWEKCYCYGKTSDGAYLVAYKVNGTSNTWKAGYVGYSGGCTF